MRHLANGEACNVAGERQFTLRDAVEVALSAALDAAGFKLSDSRWEQFAKLAASELQRQLRKTNMLTLDADLTKDIGTQAETTNHLLRILIAEIRDSKRSGNDTPTDKPRNGTARKAS